MYNTCYAVSVSVVWRITVDTWSRLYSNTYKFPFNDGKVPVAVWTIAIDTQSRRYSNTYKFLFNNGKVSVAVRTRLGKIRNK